MNFKPITNGQFDDSYKIVDKNCKITNDTTWVKEDRSINIKKIDPEKAFWKFDGFMSKAWPLIIIMAAFYFGIHLATSLIKIILGAM